MMNDINVETASIEGCQILANFVRDGNDAPGNIGIEKFFQWADRSLENIVFERQLPLDSTSCIGPRSSADMGSDDISLQTAQSLRVNDIESTADRSRRRKKSQNGG